MKIILNNFSWIYGYGFNGMEKTDEVSGAGNSYTAEFWQYDPRIGRRWNVDPMTLSYPWSSPYATFNNNPIYFSDPFGLEGEEPKSKTVSDPKGGEVKIGAEGVSQSGDKTSITNAKGQGVTWDEEAGIYVNTSEPKETYSGPIKVANNTINPDGTINYGSKVIQGVSLVNHWENPFNILDPKYSFALESDYRRSHSPKPMTVEGSKFATVWGDVYHTVKEGDNSQFMTDLDNSFGKPLIAVTTAPAVIFMIPIAVEGSIFWVNQGQILFSNSSIWMSTYGNYYLNTGMKYVLQRSSALAYKRILNLSYSGYRSLYRVPGFKTLRWLYKNEINFFKLNTYDKILREMLND